MAVTLWGLWQSEHWLCRVSMPLASSAFAVVWPGAVRSCDQNERVATSLGVPAPNWEVTSTAPPSPSGPWQVVHRAVWLVAAIRALADCARWVL